MLADLLLETLPLTVLLLEDLRGGGYVLVQFIDTGRRARELVGKCSGGFVIGGFTSKPSNRLMEGARLSGCFGAGTDGGDRAEGGGAEGGDRGTGGDRAGGDLPGGEGYQLATPRSVALSSGALMLLLKCCRAGGSARGAALVREFLPFAHDGTSFSGKGMLDGDIGSESGRLDVDTD